jgi:hypothetical protein
MSDVSFVKSVEGGGLRVERGGFFASKAAEPSGGLSAVK